MFQNETFAMMPMTMLCNLMEKYENHMTLLNTEKCHYMVSGSKDLLHQNMLNSNEITSSNEEKLLDILLNSKLNFEIHLYALFAEKQTKK